MNLALLRPMAASVVLFSLAACGGGGGGSSDAAVIEDVVVPVTIDPATQAGIGSQAEAQAAAAALLEEWAPTNPPVFTALSTIPQSGSADYAGYIFGDLSDGSGDITHNVIGSLTLEVGFNAGGADFSGTADDFVDSSDASLTGQLAVTSGSLDRDGNPANDATVGVGLSGTLTDDAGSDLVFGVQLEGDFLGTSNDAIGGAALGGVSVDGVDQDFDGGFIAER